MTDQPKQTPLPDLLDAVPEYIVLGIPDDEESQFPSYTNIPIGELARQAAAELRRLSIETKALGLHLSERMKDLARVEAQRDALLEALKQIEPILVRMYGPQAADLPPIQIVRAAIAKAEGEQA